jgi:hypothetical protein
LEKSGMLLPLFSGGFLIGLVALGLLWFPFFDPEDDTPRPARRGRRYLLTGLAVVWMLFCAAGIVQILRGNRSGPFEGGLTIQAGPGERIYIGDKLVGTTNAYVSWQDLFGWGDSPPLASAFDFGTTRLTAEQLGEPGAVFIFDASQGSGSTASGGAGGLLSYQTRNSEALLRRADGSLDLVTCLQGEYTSGRQSAYDEKRGFLVPIRIRGVPATVSRYSQGGLSSGVSFSSGPFGTRSHWQLTMQFTSGASPGFGMLTPQVIQEMKANEFWEPGK